MNRTIQALVVAALLYGTQAMAAGRLEPGTGEWEFLPAQSTYADEHAAEIANSPSTNPFPVVMDESGSRPAKETHADRRAAEIAVQPSTNPFPVVLDESGSRLAMSANADQYAAERNIQARGESDPALSD